VDVDLAEVELMRAAERFESGGGGFAEVAAGGAIEDDLVHRGEPG
jgi:hypothetical protein